MTLRRLRALAAALALVVGVAPISAHAEATADQRAEAQALFDDARRLMAEKHYAEACPKLEESQRLDPGVGTLLNLAECQAQMGRTASAWANFLEAAYQAKAVGQTKRENTARARASLLEGRLSRLTILAADGSKVEIKRDGAAVATSLLGTAVPVDPGEHTVSASAPGKSPWKTVINVGAAADQVAVSVPALEDEPTMRFVPPPPPGVQPPAPPGAPPPEAPPRREETSPGAAPDFFAGPRPRTLGIALTAVGAGGLGLAALFAGLAKQKSNDSNANGCDPVSNVCRTRASFDLRADARRDGNIATGAVVVGSLVAAGGVGLLITTALRGNPGGAAPALAVDPRGGATFGVAGSFR